jgi:adhesin transport system membrane fusion protein
MNKQPTQADLNFMSNLSAAVLERSRGSSRLITYTIVLMTLSFIIWARFAELDEVTRGVGKIVPTSKTQVIQNLEGGIVAEILVKPGDLVQYNQPLLKIDNKMFESNFGEHRLKLEDLKIRQARLLMESGLGAFKIEPELASARPDLVQNEKTLLTSNLGYLETQVGILRQQMDQRQKEIAETTARIKHLTRNRDLLQQQITLTRPMVERGIESRTDFLRLEREMVNIQQDLETSQISITRIQSSISELEKKVTDLRQSFRGRAQKELNELMAQVAQMEEKQGPLRDQVTRTHVRSPVRGFVKQLFVHTIGGVVKPGMDLLEIVPEEETLLVEAKIMPADIAFLHLGQKAMVKVTAYDYSIYGGLKGSILDISADTMTEPNGMTYFLVTVRTDENYLGLPGKPLRIIPGMIVSVDILTGKKSLLDYLLKPLLRAKQNALTEK